MRVQIELQTAAASAVVRPHPQGLLRGMTKTARPRQWIKNVLVVAAPLAGGKLLHGSVAVNTAIIFVVFCFAASGVYFLNDAIDVNADRAHPDKRRRPIAAGTVPVVAGYGTGGLLIVAAVVAAALLLNLTALVVVAVYAVVQVLYCLRLKHVPVVDIAIVASGFLLRAIGGGAATGVSPSQWFVITTGFGSLFVVAAKRAAELHRMGEDAAKTRKLLEVYSEGYLRFVWQGAAGIMTLSYCLWALDPAVPHHPLARSLSIIPMTMAVLRYSMIVDRGETGTPEDVLLGDRMMLAFTGAWIAVYGVAVFV